ncbi:hypothetical protein AGDE_17028 [Angomonas deanei]|nr:hypothetical protein AGDE_17028 [Angomonas deanei]|eukprot:EPY15662.1 hypothetical protein AGDE_17028 [Angomonas deanei]
MRRLDITESTDGLGLNVYLPALCGAFKDLNNMQEAKEMGQKAIGYGSGFALLIVAWVLVIINSIVALLPF